MGVIKFEQQSGNLSSSAVIKWLHFHGAAGEPKPFTTSPPSWPWGEEPTSTGRDLRRSAWCRDALKGNRQNESVLRRPWHSVAALHFTPGVKASFFPISPHLSSQYVYHRHMIFYKKKFKSVEEWSHLQRERSERERQESRRSDKTDGGESELICFFDERGTPRNDFLKFEQNGFWIWHLLCLRPLVTHSHTHPPLISDPLSIQ